MFLVGNCLSGAIVSISPSEAVTTGLLWNAADGGVALIAITAKPGSIYLFQAWSDEGTYLGQYTNEG